jgi:phage recombination protein Bet
MQQQLVNSNTFSGELSEQDMGVLVTSGVIPKGTPKSQALVFAHVCKEKGLSPFSKEIYLTGFQDRNTGEIKYSIITGIDGFRKIAARTGELAGCEDAKFDVLQNGNYKTIADFKPQEFPVSCTTTVYRIISGVRCAFTHTAKFSEFNTGKQKWQTMPFQMIAKVSEAFALKKGFADATSGLHVEEERGAFEGDLAGSMKTIIPETPKTEAQIQAEEEAHVASEVLLHSMKEMFADVDGNNAGIRKVSNDLKASNKHFKLLNTQHKAEFKEFVLSLLAKYPEQ